MGLSSYVVVFLIAALLAESAAGQDATRRCCPGNQVLDIELEKCVDNPIVFKTYQEESKQNDPILQCSNGWDTFKMENFTNSGVIVEPRFNQILQVAQYCINSVLVEDERNKTVVAFCRLPVLQLKKCCPIGQSVNRASVRECIPNDQNFTFSKFVTPVGWPFETVDNSSLECEYDYNIFVPKMFVDNWFTVSASTEGGQLVVRKSMYKVLRYARTYCVDTAVDAQGVEEPIGMMCLPSRMYILRFILWGVYSYLHFISAFFLLLTLIVYCIFAPLRDNIQGYSMICFLICMIVVQVEYGILLSLPTEPHTWCFFKTQASNYFRYASSTWITVMGFNIWIQLCRGPQQALNKTDTLKRFALCCLYAWGVPLALQLAVIIYRDSLGPPVRLCWFGNPIIKHLLSTPNVVLVTANLIFFIPSALKVYGSLSFLKTSVSPVVLTKLEKQRVTTIFRFFLLMQFYTIPRIVHEIVDADSASPEFLIFSVSLYLMIGPAMFYFFVCKSEVFKMITRMASGIKETTSRSTISSKISAGSTKFWRSRSYQTSMNDSTPNSPNATTSANVEPIKFQYKGAENAAFDNLDSA